MGGHSFHLGVLQLLMCHGQLSDTIYALEVARPCVGCFMMLAVYYLASQRAITQPVGGKKDVIQHLILVLHSESLCPSFISNTHIL